MDYKISYTLEEFQQLKEGWLKLYDQLPELSPFQSYEFNYYSWEYFLKDEGKLFVLSFYEANQLVAIFPTYIDRSKNLRFINDIHVDFCDILNRSATPFKLFKTFEKIISKSDQISSVQFINMESESTASQLNYHFKKRKSLRSFMQHSVLKITGEELKENFKHLTSNERGKLKRLQKINKDFNFCFNDDFNKLDILKLREEMVQSGKRNRQFLDTKFLNLIERLKENNFLQISSLKSDKPLAVSFLLKRGKYQLVWMDAYDNTPYVNLSNYIYFLNNQESGSIVSFGRGTYKYKMNNFQPLAENLYNFYYSKSLFLFTLNEVVMLLKAVLKSVLREKQY